MEQGTMSETVELLGGPADGQRIAIQHGDTIRMMRMPPGPLLLSDGPPSPPPEPIEYRRSARNPSRFIFHPTHRDGVD